MKKLLYTLIIGLTLNASAYAQIKLIGVANNTGTIQIDLVQWLAFDANSVTTTPTTLDAYLFASSAYDSFNGNYYIAGVSGQTTGLYSYNTDTGESNLATGSMSTNIAEFDMSTGKLYNLIMETEENISIYEYDIALNENVLIGTIYEPGVTGIVADAIGFDSNNGILYYAGYTNDPALALYAVPVRDEVFSFTRTILNTPDLFTNLTSLNFDNVQEKLFAAKDTYDQNGIPGGRSIVEIGLTSGDVITLGQLVDFPYFVGGSSLFDQNSGTFMLVGITTDGMLEMIAFDTYTNTYTTGFVPDNVSEIACDNTQFAQNRYAAISGVQQQPTVSFNVYPNPASDVLNLEYTTEEPAQVQIFSSMGELVYEKQNVSVNRLNIDMSTLSPGLYTVNLTSAKQTVSKKVLVK
jgi:Secretion system C-terminal sorting domain